MIELLYIHFVTDECVRKKVNKDAELTKGFYLMNSYRFELVLYCNNEGLIHF